MQINLCHSVGLQEYRAARTSFADKGFPMVVTALQVLPPVRALFQMALLLGLVHLPGVAAAMQIDSDESPTGAVETAVAPEIREVCGWKLLISSELLAKQKAETEKAVQLLQRQLEEVQRVVPQAAVRKLQTVKLYFNPTYPGSGPRAEYHPGAGWLQRNGRDPVMVKGIEFTNISVFERELSRMPNFALHELAHAWHDQFLDGGFGNQQLQQAFARMKDSGTYEEVERRFGNNRPSRTESAYALTNPMEYFAESTESFFSTNDFFPFDRNQLHQHDPEMERLLEQLWAVGKE